MKKFKQIPNESIEYFDRGAFELLEVIEVNTNSANTDSEKYEEKPVASVLEMNAIELNGPINNLIESKGDMIRAVRGKKTIGFSHEKGVLFSKFIRNVYKIHQIKSRVSESFVKQLTFDWLIEVKEKGQAQSNFSSHLLSAIEESAVEHKIFYHVVCLLINKPFAIGNVEFGFFTKEYFKYFIEKSKIDNPNEDQKSQQDLFDKYPGRCYAMAHVRAENEKAKDIAFQSCGRAIDVLKICSPTLLAPQFECTFEIDKRLTRNTETEILVETIKEDREISFTLYGAGQPFSLTDDEMIQFKIRGLDVFNEFLLGLDSVHTELQKIILIAIQRLASSLTHKDLHQRIAEICSILESLLLLNDSGSMTEMVCRYFCRLVHSEPEVRKELDRIYKEFYGIRSSWIHHAKRNSIDLPKLAYLQYCTQKLLQVLITKSKTHTIKETILSEIDDALYRA